MNGPAKTDGKPRDAGAVEAGGLRRESRPENDGGAVPPIDILFLRSGNLDRSAVVTALLIARLGDVGVNAWVRSAGLLGSGRPVPEVVASSLVAPGCDTSAHRSRQTCLPLLHWADLVLCMTREHVREAVAVCPDAWPRTYTLKEFVRLGEERGPRRTGQPLAEWLADLHAGRCLTDPLGRADADDQADPYNRSRAVFVATAVALDQLTVRLARLLIPGG